MIVNGSVKLKLSWTNGKRVFHKSKLSKHMCKSKLDKCGNFFKPLMVSFAMCLLVVSAYAQKTGGISGTILEKNHHRFVFRCYQLVFSQKMKRQNNILGKEQPTIERSKQRTDFPLKQMEAMPYQPK